MALSDLFRRGPAPPRQTSVEDFRLPYFALKARYGQHLWSESEGLELRRQLEREDFVIEDGAFVFASPITIALYWELLDYIACGAKHFLIVGERGVGKEVLAQLIARHNKNKKVIAVNCASLVDTIADAQLFGFGKDSGVAGAPKHGSSGFVSEADGQVLFLDEFFDAPASVFPKLLRLLQFPREYWPVGASTAKSLDENTIIVAASNHYARAGDLNTAMEESSVRADLLDRFEATLEVPPLRERKKELGWIAEHIVNGFGPTLPFRSLTEDAKQRLRHLPYSWPGNVRELKLFLSEQARLRRHHAPGQQLDIPEEAILSWFTKTPADPPSIGTEVSSNSSSTGALTLWSKDQLRDRQRKELVIHLMKLLLEQGQSQASAGWISEECRKLLNVENISQKLKETIGKSCRQLAEEVNHSLTNL